MEMREVDYVETWLDTVAASRSDSERTRETYGYNFKAFLKFIEASAEEIMEEYEQTTEKAFKRKYAMLVKAWVSALHREGCAPNTVASCLTAVKSFFKYNDLPLGYLPIPRVRVIYHNRDITKEEIIKIIAVSRPRERAFYTMMSQSGLRPVTLCKLQKKHIEPDFSNGVIPCCVRVPEEIAKGKFGSNFTFIGEESVRALKAYFSTRSAMTEKSPIFSGYGSHEGEFYSRKTFTNSFKRALEKLRKKGEIDFETPKHGKPAEVRLYNLRKWFRNQAAQAGVEYVNFWMGHKANYKASHIPASDEHYFSRQDVEFHRKLYAEKAMPFLRLETATPSETEKEISELRKQLERRDKEITEMKKSIEKLEPLTWFLEDFESPEEVKEFLEALKWIRSCAPPKTG